MGRAPDSRRAKRQHSDSLSRRRRPRGALKRAGGILQRGLRAPRVSHVCTRRHWRSRILRKRRAAKRVPRSVQRAASGERRAVCEVLFASIVRPPEKEISVFSHYQKLNSHCQDFFRSGWCQADSTPPLSGTFRSGRKFLWAICRWIQTSTSEGQAGSTMLSYRGVGQRCEQRGLWERIVLETKRMSGGFSPAAASVTPAVELKLVHRVFSHCHGNSARCTDKENDAGVGRDGPHHCVLHAPGCSRRIRRACPCAKIELFGFLFCASCTAPATVSAYWLNAARPESCIH